MRGVDGDAAHLAGVALEGVADGVLDDERLDGLRAGHALVEAVRDFRVGVSDPAVEGDETPLEVAAEQDGGRHQGHHHEGEPRLDGEHHADHADEVGGAPDEVHRGPRDEEADVVRVAHHAGVDVADLVLVEVGQRQRLQVVEAGVAEVAREAHLELGAEVGGNEVREGLGDDDGEVERREGPDAVQRPLPYEMVDRVAVEEREGGVAGAPGETEEDHHGHRRREGAEEGPELRDAEPAEGGAAGRGGVSGHGRPPFPRGSSGCRGCGGRCRPWRAAPRGCRVRRRAPGRARGCGRSA